LLKGARFVFGRLDAEPDMPTLRRSQRRRRDSPREQEPPVSRTGGGGQWRAMCSGARPGGRGGGGVCLGSEVCSPPLVSMAASSAGAVTTAALFRVITPWRWRGIRSGRKAPPETEKRSLPHEYPFTPPRLCLWSSALLLCGFVRSAPIHQSHLQMFCEKEQQVAETLTSWPAFDARCSATWRPTAPPLTPEANAN
jgi:hypothetical protein